MLPIENGSWRRQPSLVLFQMVYVGIEIDQIDYWEATTRKTTIPIGQFDNHNRLKQHPYLCRMMLS